MTTRSLVHVIESVPTSDGEGIRVQAGPEGVRFLLLAARPLREPVVQYGPFVMNTREEIEQAIADYRDGRLAAVAAAGKREVVQGIL
jgi:redox-sensitive bicupin YhaK (pirin superfamily)